MSESILLHHPSAVLEEIELFGGVVVDDHAVDGGKGIPLGGGQPREQKSPGDRGDLDRRTGGRGCRPDADLPLDQETVGRARRLRQRYADLAARTASDPSGLACGDALPGAPDTLPTGTGWITGTVTRS